MSRAQDIAELTAPYRLVVVDECHHVPAVAFSQAVQQIAARRWLGLTATPYRRDQLDDLIALQLGPVRHTITPPAFGVLPTAAARAETPEPIVHVHPTNFTYDGPANPSDPGGMAAIYRDLVAAQERTQQVVADVGARSRKQVLDELVAASGGPIHVVGTGSYIGEGLDCPALDTLFLAAPIASKGRLVQYVGRVLRPHPGKHTAEVHDYHDERVGVLAFSLAKRAPGYTSLGFTDPRHLAH